MTDAKMSIVESSSEAHTLMEPVSQPVAVLIKMRKAAASTERRAAELFSLASDRKMSIVESSSEAHTLMEPVSQPVAVLIKMRKAAASTERRAAELFSLA